MRGSVTNSLNKTRYPRVMRGPVNPLKTLDRVTMHRTPYPYALPRMEIMPSQLEFTGAYRMLPR